MSRILVVSPYPPQPDGIAAYASQTVRRLRASGNDVEVLSPGPSAAHHHLDLCGPRGALALAKRVRSYDRVTIQFHPDFFYRQPMSTDVIARESLALLAVATAARHLEVRVHEIDYRWGTRRDLASWATRRFWRAVKEISVHTDRERADFIEAFGVDPARVRVVEHGSDFIAHTSLDREQARAALGLPTDAICLLAIGFIQRHKGYDRAIEAFREISAPANARVDIVGAIRVEDRENALYLSELQELVDTVPGAHLHAGFVTDEAFDRWIVACDSVVLPYRAIWSSGVLERALLLGRPVIVSDVGGLREQTADRPGVTIVADDAELQRAMAAVVHPGALRPVGTEPEPWPATTLTTADAQRVISDRATRRRGRPAPLPGTPHQVLPRSGVELPLHEMQCIGLPEVHGNNPLSRRVKHLVRRLTGWQIDPIIHHVNALHAATVDAISPSEPRLADDNDTAQPGGVAETRR